MRTKHNYGEAFLILRYGIGIMAFWGAAITWTCGAVAGELSPLQSTQRLLRFKPARCCKPGLIARLLSRRTSGSSQ